MLPQVRHVLDAVHYEGTAFAAVRLVNVADSLLPEWANWIKI